MFFEAEAQEVLYTLLSFGAINLSVMFSRILLYLFGLGRKINVL